MVDRSKAVYPSSSKHDKSVLRDPSNQISFNEVKIRQDRFKIRLGFPESSIAQKFYRDYAMDHRFVEVEHERGTCEVIIYLQSHNLAQDDQTRGMLLREARNYISNLAFLRTSVSSRS